MGEAPYSRIATRTTGSSSTGVLVEGRRAGVDALRCSLRTWIGRPSTCEKRPRHLAQRVRLLHAVEQEPAAVSQRHRPVRKVQHLRLAHVRRNLARLLADHRHPFVLAGGDHRGGKLTIGGGRAPRRHRRRCWLGRSFCWSGRRVRPRRGRGGRTSRRPRPAGRRGGRRGFHRLGNREHRPRERQFQLQRRVHPRPRRRVRLRKHLQRAHDVAQARALRAPRQLKRLVLRQVTDGRRFR